MAENNKVISQNNGNVPMPDTMSAEININTLPLYVSDEINGYVVIQTKWMNDTVEVLLCESFFEKNFEGTVTIEHMYEIADELNMTYSDFYTECFNALTCHMGSPDFRYVLDLDRNRFFLIKKKSYSFQLLDVKLVEINNCCKMLVTAADIIAEKKTAISDGKVLVEKLRDDYRKLSDAFDKCVKEKNDSEQEMAKKMAQLVNSKKQRFADLQNIYTQAPITTTTSTSTNTNPNISISASTNTSTNQFNDDDKEDTELDTKIAMCEINCEKIMREEKKFGTKEKVAK